MSASATLFRPVGPAELALIAATGYRAFPPRLAAQPIFYPVLDEAYAREIAERWNVPESGAGYVTRFAVDAGYLAAFPIQMVGARHHRELWVPAEELATFNAHIIGAIEVIATFGSVPG